MAITGDGSRWSAGAAAAELEITRTQAEIGELSHPDRLFRRSAMNRSCYLGCDRAMHFARLIP